MIAAELPDIQRIADRARSCSHGTLVEVFLALVNTAYSFLHSNDETPAVFRNNVLNVLSQLPTFAVTQTGSTKARQPPAAKLKKRPPPSKKPPPGPKAQLVSQQSKRYALFWTPVNGPPPSVTGSIAYHVSPLIQKACEAFQIQLPPVTDIGDLRGPSIFSEDLLSQNDRESLRRATQPDLLDPWFEKRTKETTAPLRIVKSKTRTSVLSPGMAQRLSILVLSLRRSISSKATTEDVVHALLECSLGIREVELLVDIVPGEDDRKRYEEWQAGIRSIQQLLQQEPLTQLLEDEEFLLVLSKFPKPRDRLQCMYITCSFDSIVEGILEKLGHMIDGLRLLLKHERIHFTWQLLLHVGNALNEGTKRSGQKCFRMQALARALDIRGNKTMTLPEYMAAFTGQILDAQSWRALQKAKESVPVSVFASASNILETYIVLLGHEGNRAVDSLPAPVTDPRVLVNRQDMFVERMRQFATERYETAKKLLEQFVTFVQLYASAAYFYGDPDSLLPLEAGIDGDSENEDSQARDLFLRVSTLVAGIQSRLNQCQRVFQPPLTDTKKPKLESLPASALADTRADASTEAPIVPVAGYSEQLLLPSVMQSTTQSDSEPMTDGLNMAASAKIRHPTGASKDQIKIPDTAASVDMNGALQFSEPVSPFNSAPGFGLPSSTTRDLLGCCSSAQERDAIPLPVLRPSKPCSNAAVPSAAAAANPSESPPSVNQILSCASPPGHPIVNTRTDDTSATPLPRIRHLGVPVPLAVAEQAIVTPAPSATTETTLLWQQRLACPFESTTALPGDSRVPRQGPLSRIQASGIYAIDHENIPGIRNVGNTVRRVPPAKPGLPRPGGLRFGYRPGGKSTLDDSQAIRRLREKLMAKEVPGGSVPGGSVPGGSVVLSLNNKEDGPTSTPAFTLPEGLLAPAAPPAGRRRPRSSIEATYHLARAFRR